MARPTQDWLCGAALFVLLAFAALAPAAAAEPAGQVIIAVGRVQAVDAAGQSRGLSRRAAVFAGDRIVTGPRGRAQLRFADGGIMSLKADTELRIDEFRFEQGGAGEDRSLFTLLKGGFRTVTGAIGKADPDAYRVDTPVATIGIRGTNYETLLQDGLLVAVWDGGVRVRNDGGQLDLGAGANFNYARVSSGGQPPKGLVAPPPGLEGGGSAGLDGNGDGSDQASEEGDSEEEGAGEDGSSEDGSGEEASGEEAIGEGGAQDTETATTDTGDSSEDGSAVLDEGDDGSVTLSSTDGGGTTTSTTDSTTATTTGDAGTLALTEVTNGGTAALVGLKDARLTQAEWESLDRFGIMVFGSAKDDTMLGGKASSGADGSPIFADWESAPWESGWGEGNPAEVAKRGTAQAVELGSSSALKVNWGVWNAGPAHCSNCSIEVYYDPNDATQVNKITAPAFWITAVPTTSIPAQARTYSDTLMVKGGGNVSGNHIQVTGFEMNLTVDLANNQINAAAGPELRVYSNDGSYAYRWDVEAVGGGVRRVNGAAFVELDLHNGSTSRNASGKLYNTTMEYYMGELDGEAVGIVVGQQAEGLAGTFSLQQRDTYGDVTNHVEGIYLVRDPVASP